VSSKRGVTAEVGEEKKPDQSTKKLLEPEEKERGKGEGGEKGFCETKKTKRQTMKQTFGGISVAKSISQESRRLLGFVVFEESSTPKFAALLHHRL
jgi:hypothetical protein